MTQYAKDFSDELTTGVYASDFTSRYSTTAEWTIEAPGDAEDDRVFQGTSGAGIDLNSWDDIDGDANRDNCELLARWRISADVATNIPELFARASGSVGNETSYQLTTRSTGNWEFYRYNTGSFNASGVTLNADGQGMPQTMFTSDRNPAHTHHALGLWQWARFRVNGTGATVTLQAKLWIDGINGVNEPKDWMMTWADTTGSRITAAGWVGIGRQGHTGTLEYDYFAVGTNGDAAPLNASTNTVVRVTSIYAEVMGSEANPPVRVTQNFAEVFGSHSSPSARVTAVYVSVAHARQSVSPDDDVSGQLIVTT